MSDGSATQKENVQPDTSAADAGKGKGKGAATEPTTTQEVSMDEDDSSSEEEVDPVSVRHALLYRDTFTDHHYTDCTNWYANSSSYQQQVTLLILGAVDEEDVDNMEEIDTSNILNTGRRTRGRQIDFAKAAKDLPEEDDDEDDDDDFEEEHDESKMDED